MDEPKLVLRIACERGEFVSIVPTELRAEQTQVVEKLNGFGVGHQYSAECWQTSLLN